MFNWKLDYLYMSDNVFICLCLVALLFSSCSKEYQPGEVTGTWKSLHEEWTITENGESSKETFDYGDAPTEESAVMRLYHSDYYMFSDSNNASKMYTLEYSDRFSIVDSETKERSVTTISARLGRNKITGSNGATWVIRKVDGDLMEIDYDNGVKEGEVSRQCRFVFLRIASGVTK